MGQRVADHEDAAGYALAAFEGFHGHILLRQTTATQDENAVTMAPGGRKAAEAASLKTPAPIYSLI